MKTRITGLKVKNHCCLKILPKYTFFLQLFLVYSFYMVYFILIHDFAVYKNTSTSAESARVEIKLRVH